MEFNVDEVCRTCLNKANPLHSIFDEKCLALNSVPYAVDFLQSFCKITACNVIKLPSKVCSTCADEIKRAYAFKIQCERSAETLSRYIEELIKKDKKIILKKKEAATSPKTLSQTISVSARSRKHDSDDEEIRKRKTRKKVTEKRPVESSEDDVVLIDDDDSTTPAETTETVTFDSCPLVISRITSAANTEQRPPISSESCPLVISQITSGNEVVFLDKSVAKSNDPPSIEDTNMMSADEEIYLVEISNEEDAQTPNALERSDSTSNKENELNSAQVPKETSDSRLKDGADDIIEIDDDDPVHNELFLCHICSDVFQGEDEFLKHVLDHKDSTNTLATSSSIINPGTSKNNISVVIDSFLCHTCRKLISGSDNFVAHVKSCEKNAMRCNELEVSIWKQPDGKSEAGRSVPIIDRFVCRKCDKVVTGTNSFIIHMKICSGTDSKDMDPVMSADLSPFLNRFLCLGCNKMHLGIENFEAHVRNCRQLLNKEVKIKAVISKNGLACGLCRVICSDQDSFIDHACFTHMLQKEKFVCGVCNHGFPLAQFVTHIKGRFCGQFNCKHCVASLFSTGSCPFHKSISSWCKK